MKEVTCNNKHYYAYDADKFKNTNLAFICGQVSHEFDLCSAIDEPRCRCYNSKDNEIFLLRAQDKNKVDVYVNEHHACSVTVGFDDDDHPAYFITRVILPWLFCQNEFDLDAKPDPELRFDIEVR